MIRKTVFITGGSGDIGKSIALKFAQKGYNIATTFCSKSTAKLEHMCKEYNVDFKAYKMDLKNEEEIVKTFKEVFSNFEYIDCVVCNAGKAEKETFFSDVSSQSIDDLISINLKGTILCNQQAFKYFLKQKHGNIINISSIFGISGGACETVYSATKAGIIGLTKSLALESAPYNIRVNAIAPGYIKTNMTAHFTEEEKEITKESTPLKRLGTGEDIANAVYFLASEESSFITGEVLTVSGGVLRF